MNKHTNLSVARTFLLAGLSLSGGFAQAQSIFDASAAASLSISSITNSVGGDATASFDISFDPYTSQNYGNPSSVSGVNDFGTSGSSYSGDPLYLSANSLDQSSEAHGTITPVGAGTSTHTTSGTLGLSLNGNASSTDTYTVNFVLSYNLLANATVNNTSLESSYASSSITLANSLGFTYYDNGTGTNVTVTALPSLYPYSLDADASGILAPHNISSGDTLLFSVIFNTASASTDSILLTTFAQGNAQAVPIPAAVWLFGSALAGFGLFGTRRSKPA